MKQRYRMNCLPDAGKYIVFDDSTSEVVASYPYKSENDRSRAYTFAKIDMQERNSVAPRSDLPDDVVAANVAFASRFD